MANPAAPENKIRAKLFANGRSQAVRLPKDFRFEGKEVQVSKVLGGVLLEPVEAEQSPKVTVQSWFAEMDALRDGHLFPEREEQPPAEERDPIL
jgi:antitoxin VapB